MAPIPNTSDSDCGAREQLSVPRGAQGGGERAFLFGLHPGPQGVSEPAVGWCGQLVCRGRLSLWENTTACLWPAQLVQREAKSTQGVYLFIGLAH